MKTRCINLKDHEVRGLLDGSITALWRPVKTDFSDCQPVGVGMYHPYRIDKHGESYPAPEVYGMWGDDWDIPAPYQPGDVLIGREAHAFLFHADGKLDGNDYNIYCEHSDHGTFDIRYRADGLPVDWDGGWRSGPSMPQWASRIRRELVAVECIQSNANDPQDTTKQALFWKLTPKSE